MASFFGTILREETTALSPGPRAVASSASRTSRMTSRPDPWRRAVDVLLAQSIARVASAHPSAPLPQGKRRASSSADDDIIDRLRASAQLCKQMSAAHVARVIGTTERRVIQAPTAAARLLLFHFVCWSAGYIRSSLAGWRRLRNFAGSRETVDGFTIARFLDNVDEQARMKKANNSAADGDASRPSELPGFLRSDAKGATAAHQALAGLKWMNANAGTVLPLDAAALKRFKVTPTESSAAAPSMCMSLRIVVSLERLSTSSQSQFVAGHCGGFVLQHFTASRFTQLQRASTVLDRGDTRTMMTNREKNPTLGRSRPRAFWAPKDGIEGRGYLDAVDAMLEDLHEPTFIIRDTNSPDGDPRKATAWLDQACTGARATVALRACIEAATGMPAEEAKWYGVSSARHFLPLVAMLCNESADRRNELGRWAGSAATSSSVLPAERAAARQARRSSAMPNRYAGAAVPTLVTSIIQAQIKACSNVLAKTGFELLPMHGGFELFSETSRADGGTSPSSRPESPSFAARTEPGTSP